MDTELRELKDKVEKLKEQVEDFVSDFSQRLKKLEKGE